MSKLNTNLKFKNGKSKFTVNGIIFISLKQENITDFDTMKSQSDKKYRRKCFFQKLSVNINDTDNMANTPFPLSCDHHDCDNRV